MSKDAVAYLFLRKSELLSYVNVGRLRILSKRVVSDSELTEKVFAVGITTSPTDAENCVVVGLANSWNKSKAHRLSNNRDLIWLELNDLVSISAIKEVDEAALKEIVSDRFLSIFLPAVEAKWLKWVAAESIDIHLEAAQELLGKLKLPLFSKKIIQGSDLRSLTRAILGFEAEVVTESSILGHSFFANLHLMAREVGVTRGSIRSILRVAKAWANLNKVQISDDIDQKFWANIEKFIDKLPSELIEVTDLRLKKVMSKSRVCERRFASIYTKELRPLLMAAVIDSSYRISGEVFKVDDLKRLVHAIDHFEGHKAAQLFVLFVACRLGPELVKASQGSIF